MESREENITTLVYSSGPWRETRGHQRATGDDENKSSAFKSLRTESTAK